MTISPQHYGRTRSTAHEVSIRGHGPYELGGDLFIPEVVNGVVVFPHASATGRKNATSRQIARYLGEYGHVATLLVDLLTPDEAQRDDLHAELRSDVLFLAERLLMAREWLTTDERTSSLKRVAYLGMRTEAPVALLAASIRTDIATMVVCGGCPDLAGSIALERIEAPTLFVAGDQDRVIVDLNVEARRYLRCESSLRIVPGASSMFIEPGAIDEVARVAADWFLAFLPPPSEAQKERAQRQQQRSSGIRPVPANAARDRTTAPAPPTRKNVVTKKKTSVLAPLDAVIPSIFPSVDPPLDPKRVTSVVVMALADRLTAGEAHDLVEMLPSSVRDLLPAEAGDRAGRPPSKADRAELVAHVANDLGITPAHAEVIVHAVLGVVRAALPPEIVEHAGAQLPRDLKDLWFARAPVGQPAIPPVGVRLKVEAEIAQQLRLPKGVTPTAALTAVVSVFTSRLSGGEALDVLLGLPNDLRPLFEDAMLDREERPHLFGRAELVRAVAERLGVAPADAEPLVPAMLHILKMVLPVKEIDDVTSQLPADLRDLWLAA